jgi:hypothetical protein
LVDKQDGIVRMKSSMFERLVRDPLHHSMPELAGQRARVAEIIVELRDRVPVQVVRRVYFVLPFDDQGRVDIERIRKQQYALAASVIDPVLAPRKDPADLHDAADRFIAQGGKWRPTAELARSDRPRRPRHRGIAVAPHTGGRPEGCPKCANALQYSCVCTDSGD